MPESAPPSDRQIQVYHTPRAVSYFSDFNKDLGDKTG
jgi:hypothetical protein